MNHDLSVNDSLSKLVVKAGASSANEAPNQLVLDAVKARIFDEIIKERAYQETLWKDESPSERVWLLLILDYLYNTGEARKRKFYRTFRERLLKVASLAVAAIEVIDRKS